MPFAVSKILVVVITATSVLIGSYVMLSTWRSLELRPPVRFPTSLISERDGLKTGEKLPPPNAILVNLEEVYVNLPSQNLYEKRSLGIQLDLELFGEDGRSQIERSKAGIRHTVIQLSREQNYYQLSSLHGKLYFKEQLVSKLNEFLQQPIVRDIYFAGFTLQ